MDKLERAIILRDKLYDPKAGGHKTPGCRCRCSPFAGILTDESWGVYSLDEDKLSKEELRVIEAIEMFAGHMSEEIEKGNGDAALKISDAITSMIRGMRFITEISTYIVPQTRTP